VLASPPMRIEVLMTPGCGHGRRAVALLEEVLRQGGYAGVVETVLVDSVEEAARRSFPGSPTVRVDGVDVDPVPPVGFGLG